MRSSSPSNQLRPVLLALAAAVGVGVAGRVAIRAGAHLPHGDELVALGRAAVALGAPWLAVAWAVGATAGSRARGAAGGAAALGLGTGLWYVLTVATGGRAAVAYAVPVAAAWGAVALAAGGLFGLAGAAWRDGGHVERAIGVAVVAGALAGESLLLAGEWSGRAAQAVLAAEAAFAIALVVAARRRAPLVLTVALFALAAAALALGEETVREALREAGWGGP